MMIAFILVFGLCFFGATILAYFARNSVHGYEDAAGFHVESQNSVPVAPLSTRHTDGHFPGTMVAGTDRKVA
jgi:hypothetical protein